MRVPFVLPVLTALALTACGGGSSDPAAPAFTAQFTASGTPAAANLVRMTPAVVDRDLVRINVVIGGPTTSSDLYTFAFDLVLSDPTVAAYVPGTAQAGTALQPSGGQTVSVLVGPDSARPNRVVVGVSKVGGGSGSGNGVASGEATVVSLVFRVLRRDVTSISFGGSSSNPTSPNFDPVALNSQQGVISSVDFDSAPVRLTGL